MPGVHPAGLEEQRDPHLLGLWKVDSSSLGVVTAQICAAEFGCRSQAQVFTPAVHRGLRATKSLDQQNSCGWAESHLDCARFLGSVQISSHDWFFG